MWWQPWLNDAATLLNLAGETPSITPPTSADGFPRCRLSDTIMALPGLSSRGHARLRL
ncbi:hypothetical protein SMG44B_20085 [Stenotrophomonas maltophilia]|nr:hypothetical protein BN126310400 [Stenotrophomonas maltophilia]